MTYTAGHMSVYSFGRAVIALDQHSQEREGIPEEVRRTGCLKLLPMSISTDYDARRRTIIVEC